eukprot:2553845-Pyramimonas_sp.AAC.1
MGGRRPPTSLTAVRQRIVGSDAGVPAGQGRLEIGGAELGGVDVGQGHRVGGGAVHTPGVG